MLALLLSTAWAVGRLPGSEERREPLEQEEAGQLSGSQPQPGEGRPSLLGHYAYAEAPPESLQVVGYYHGREVRLRHAAAESYRRMSAAALADGIRLVPISGFRSVAEQEALFFQVAQAKALRPEERAAVSAPLAIVSITLATPSTLGMPSFRSGISRKLLKRLLRSAGWRKMLLVSALSYPFPAATHKG